MKNILYLGCIAIVLTACKKDSDDDTPGPGGGNADPVTITSTSPEYVFWGEELTINGTGFSSTPSENFVWFAGNDCGTDPNDSTDWKRAEVVFASATRLVVKMPHTIYNGMVCGPDLTALLRVNVSGKPLVIASTSIRPMGFPIPINFCDNYGGGYISPTMIRPDDSVYLSYSGFGLINLHTSGSQSRLRFSVGNTLIPFSFRPGLNCSTWGITFKLPMDYAEASCSPVHPQYGIAGKTYPFKLRLEGVEGSEVSKELFVANLPKATYGSASGPAEVSKSAGGNPHWVVVGKNMTYEKVVFNAIAPCTGNTGEISTACNSFCDQLNVYIPLSVLNAGCTYTITLKDKCGSTKLIGSVKILA